MLIAVAHTPWDLSWPDATVIAAIAVSVIAAVADGAGRWWN